MILCLHQKFKSMSVASIVVTEIDMKEGQLAISEMILIIMLNHISLKTQKIYFLNYYYQTLNEQQQLQSIAHQTKQILRRFLIKSCLKQKYIKLKLTLLVTSTYICGKMVIMFSKNTICFDVIQSRMMLKTTLISAQCLA